MLVLLKISSLIIDFMVKTVKLKRITIIIVILLIYLNFQPLEVASRYRDPKPQVVEKYSYLFSLRPNMCKYRCLNNHFITNNSGLIG